MLPFRPLPWDYAVRNLFRRPLRTALTFVALSMVILLVLAVVGVVRGLQRSLAVTGTERTALVLALGMGENVEYSSIPRRTGDLLAATLPFIDSRYGQKYVSPELYLGTEISVAPRAAPAMGLVRGVTTSARLVREQMEIEEGHWPRSGEVLVGSLAATKLGVDRESLRPGAALQFEDRSWRVSGTFSAEGSALESELWCPLDDLQQAMKRQDLSLVAVTLASADHFADLDLFCKQRVDLELQAVRENDYYMALQRDYQPLVALAWLTVALISAAGAFAGLNTMYGSVLGRIPELSMLQTLGYVRPAILCSLVQEGLILSAAASLAAAAAGIVLMHGIAVRFTMGAFALRIDHVGLLTALAVGLAVGVLGAAVPAARALRLPIVEGLRSP